MYFKIFLSIYTNVFPSIYVASQGRRKQLLIGPAKGMAVKEKCAKHTQHANARGSGGMPPQEIFEKPYSEIASDSFLRANIPS